MRKCHLILATCLKLWKCPCTSWNTHVLARYCKNTAQFWLKILSKTMNSGENWPGIHFSFLLNGMLAVILMWYTSSYFFLNFLYCFKYTACKSFFTPYNSVNFNSLRPSRTFSLNFRNIMLKKSSHIVFVISNSNDTKKLTITHSQ